MWALAISLFMRPVSQSRSSEQQVSVLVATAKAGPQAPRVTRLHSMKSAFLDGHNNLADVDNDR
jgi:hypothetical protein